MSINAPAGYRLGINTGFAVNRYSEHEEWIRIVGEDLGLGVAQLTADMLNVDLPSGVISRQADVISKYCAKYKVKITSTFTGAFTRVNHLAHPDPEIRAHWVKWFKRFVDLSVDIGATSMGSHFGIFTHRDCGSAERRAQNISHWHEIGAYAKDRGLEYLSWEPMSIGREQGETLIECRRLQDDVNDGAPIDFRICLDVDHGDVSSPNPEDTDPYAWIKAFGAESPLVHLKQSSSNKGGHWPFTAFHNKEGRIHPGRVVSSLMETGRTDCDLLLELSFREREPHDSTVVEVLKESVDYWRPTVKN
jgi:sugar phosphate isomerase/epimerase